MKPGGIIKKLNNRKAFTLAELLAVVLILALIMTTLSGGLTVVKTAYDKITLKAESATLMSTIITKVADELRFASEIDASGDPITFESGIKGYRICIKTLESGGKKNIVMEAAQGSSGGNTISQPVVSEKTLTNDVEPEILLNYNESGRYFDVTVTIKKDGNTVMEQEFTVTPVNN